jgi:hypothetical protein
VKRIQGNKNHFCQKQVFILLIELPIIMSESKTEKSKEEKDAELKKQQAEAAQQLSELLGTSGGAPNAPKNLGQGLSSGVSNIVGGAVGAVGIAVLAPTAGLAMGASQGGLLGGRLTYGCFIPQGMGFELFITCIYHVSTLCYHNGSLRYCWLDWWGGRGCPRCCSGCRGWCYWRSEPSSPRCGSHTSIHFRTSQG